MTKSSRQQTLTVMAVALCLSLATAQTFEYSRGWTNGRKRSEGSPSVGMGPAGSPILGLLSSSAFQIPGKLSNFSVDCNSESELVPCSSTRKGHARKGTHCREMKREGGHALQAHHVIQYTSVKTCLYSYGFQSVRSRLNALEDSLDDAFGRSDDLFVGGGAGGFAEN